MFEFENTKENEIRKIKEQEHESIRNNLKLFKVSTYISSIVLSFITVLGMTAIVWSSFSNDSPVYEPLIFCLITLTIYFIISISMYMLLDYVFLWRRSCIIEKYKKKYKNI